MRSIEKLMPLQQLHRCVELEALDAVITVRLGISDELVFPEWCADSVGGLHRIASNFARRSAVPQIWCVTRPEDREQ